MPMKLKGIKLIINCFLSVFQNLVEYISHNIGIISHGHFMRTCTHRISRIIACRQKLWPWFLSMTCNTEFFIVFFSFLFIFTGKIPIGELFNPGYDCSKILDSNPEAKDGMYFIHLGTEYPKQVRAFIITHRNLYFQSNNILRSCFVNEDVQNHG